MLTIDEGFRNQDEIGRQSLVEASNRVQGDFTGVQVKHPRRCARGDVFPIRLEVSKTPQGSGVQVM